MTEKLKVTFVETIRKWVFNTPKARNGKYTRYIIPVPREVGEILDPRRRYRIIIEELG